MSKDKCQYLLCFSRLVSVFNLIVISLVLSMQFRKFTNRCALETTKEEVEQESSVDWLWERRRFTDGFATAAHLAHLHVSLH